MPRAVRDAETGGKPQVFMPGREAKRRTSPSGVMLGQLVQVSGHQAIEPCANHWFRVDTVRCRKAGRAGDGRHGLWALVG